MACSDLTGGLERYREALTSGQYVDAFFCPMYDQLGVELAAVMLVAPIALGFYIYSESVSMPIVLTLVLGAFFIPQLPSTPVQLAVVVVLIGGTLAAMYWIRRSSRDFR